MTTYQNERYADTVIGSINDHFDALEIQGVREYTFPDQPNRVFCEVDNDNPDFYTVYAHNHTEGGVDAVGDFTNHAEAVQYAEELAQLYSLPITDYTKV